MWKGLYNHAERPPPPRQSPAVRGQGQQLEAELTNHQEVPAGGPAHHPPGSRQGILDTNTHTQRSLRLARIVQSERFLSDLRGVQVQSGSENSSTHSDNDSGLI